VIASTPPQTPAAFEVTVSSFILRAAGLKERRKPPGEASFARFQICLTTPSLKNPRQFVNDIFARSLESKRCASSGRRRLLPLAAFVMPFAPSIGLSGHWKVFSPYHT